MMDTMPPRYILLKYYTHHFVSCIYFFHTYSFVKTNATKERHNKSIASYHIYILQFFSCNASEFMQFSFNSKTNPFTNHLISSRYRSVVAFFLPISVSLFHYYTSVSFVLAREKSVCVRERQRKKKLSFVTFHAFSLFYFLFPFNFYSFFFLIHFP